MSARVPSVYNVRAIDTEGRVVYANTSSGAAVAVDDAIDQVLVGAHHGLSPLDDRSLDLLESLGLVTSHAVDERAVVRDTYARDRDGRGLSLTVSPTVACNLRCTYCFEVDHPVRYLDDRERRAIVALARRSLDDGARSFDVTWFGGEPLLHLDGLVALSKDFIRLATFRGVGYAASIITNGTLLTPETAATLRAHRVLEAQISVDGPQTSHDQLRVDARGRGSYERVLAGIAAAVPYLDVRLRIHVDRTNRRTIDGLLDDLAARGLTAVRPSFVRVEPPAMFRHRPGATVPRRFLAVAEFAEAEVGWIERAVSLGFPAEVSISPGPALLPCAAVDRTHLAIEPGGSVKRCWIDVADDATSSGSLLDDGTVVLDDGDSAWRDYVPFDLGCARCTYLPLCMGGCPKARVSGHLASDAPEDERRDFKERYVCSPRKFNLSALLAKGLVR